MPSQELDELYFKNKLEKILDEIQAFEATGKEAAQTVELDQSRIGRLSRMDALQSQALNKETNRMREIRKERALAALERIQNGEYGICVKCGQPINPGRLDFDPTSFLCVPCAE